jgi:hypothetical protein
MYRKWEIFSRTTGIYLGSLKINIQNMSLFLHKILIIYEWEENFPSINFLE